MKRLRKGMVGITVNDLGGISERTKVYSKNKGEYTSVLKK